MSLALITRPKCMGIGVVTPATGPGPAVVFGAVAVLVLEEHVTKVVQRRGRSRQLKAVRLLYQLLTTPRTFLTCSGIVSRLSTPVQISSNHP